MHLSNASLKRFGVRPKFVSSVKTGYVRCPGQPPTNLTTRFVCGQNFTILLPIEWGLKGERLGGGIEWH